MTSPPADEHVSGFGAPAVELERRAERGDGSRAGAHARRLAVPQVEVPRHPQHDRLRYYLCCLEPSGEFDEVIVAVTDGGRRRYFATRDGERLAEVDEDAFERRSEGGARSLLELDERELGELEAELHFVRPVRGRDPIAEAAEVAAVTEATDAAEAADAAGAADATEPSDAADAADAEANPTKRAEADPTTDAEADPESDAEADPASDAASDEFELDAAADEPAAPAAPDPPADPGTTTDEDWTMEEFEAEMMVTTTEPTQPIGLIDEEESERRAVAASVSPAVVGAVTPTPEIVAVAQVSLARGIAFVAHRGRLDKSGLPYVDHPGRVAERFDMVAEHVEAAAAWLHDVLEDTPITAQELLEAGVLPEIVEVVALLTRTADVSPDEYYARIRRHPVALAVKLADIDDNTAPWRLRRLDYAKQLRLVEKYAYARRALGMD